MTVCWPTRRSCSAIWSPAGSLFNASFDVLLYDLTSTDFEIDAAAKPEGDKPRHGYSRDKRPDCPQVVIALVVTPDGLPLADEVMAGNTSDNKTLRSFLAKIETQYGKARRIWVMDRGIPTEEVLAEMRQSDPPVQYLVGTPKGRLTRLEKHRIDKPWQEVREGVQVKLLAEDGELYVFAQSDDRRAKERAMRKRQMKWLWKRLRQLAAMEVSREEIASQRRLHPLAPGLTARSALEKFAAVQMIDVHLPTTDGRELRLTRYTQPEPELQLLLKQMKLVLPPHPPPKISGTAVANQSRP